MILNKDTRVFITGCGGMLGQAIYERFNRFCSVLATDIDVNETWLEYLDVRDIASLLRKVSEFKPDLIINLAALTDLEYREKNQEEAWLTNALGQENICSASQRCNATVVYICTAGIFDGKQEFYHDFDTPNPLSYYGKSKYYGETITQLMLNKYFIFRAGWMMGGGLRKDKKFISKIFKQVKAGAKDSLSSMTSWACPRIRWISRLRCSRWSRAICTGSTTWYARGTRAGTMSHASSCDNCAWKTA